MFAIEVQSSFNASHALRLPGGQIEPSHAHAFLVVVRLSSKKLDAMETVVDFHLIEKALIEILEPWQNQNLNLLEPFKSAVNPSAERIAEHIGRELQAGLAALADSGARNLQLTEVRLTEAPDCLAIWSAD